jgi:predicted HicB family RNase H-like nuclease
MVTPRNRKSLRKPRHVLIDPEALHKARIEALRSKKTLGAWLEEAIDEKIEREQKKVK